MFLLTTFSAFAILALPLPARAELQHCALLGPDIPPHRRPSNSTAFQNAIVSIQKSISDAISSGNATFGMMDASSTSFSVDIFSQHEESLFDYHWDAPGLANSTEGVKEIDSHSLYRIGGISTLLTVYIFLISIGDSAFNEPITKYIPELATYSALNPASNNEIDITDWSSVTIGSLTSHLGGIPLGGAGDARADPADAMYLPPGVPLPTIISPIPGNISDDGCLNVAHHSRPPGTGAFPWTELLKHCVCVACFRARIHDEEEFTTLFEENFILPLGLNETYYSNAPISQGVISHNDSVAVFSEDLIFIDPAGSYYSSSNDLRKIGQSILGSKLLSPAQTRRWMKPSMFTANDDMLVGAPWEIFKAPASSGGHIGLYYSNFVLLPDWDIGFTVLVAGDDAVPVNTVISDIIAAIAIPALEAAAKEEANTTYSGTYTSNVYHPNETLSIEVDEYPGLAVTEWVLNGTDMIKGFNDVGYALRLNPSGLKSADGEREGWRMVIQLQSQEEGAFVLNCMDWFIVDAAVYGGVGLDEFVIELSGDGRATSVDARGFRGVYERA